MSCSRYRCANPFSYDQFKRVGDLKTLRFLPEFIKINASVTSEVARGLTDTPNGERLLHTQGLGASFSTSLQLAGSHCSDVVLYFIPTVDVAVYTNVFDYH